MMHRDEVERLAEEAAKIPLVDEAVLALLRQHLGGSDAVLFWPAIAAKKEASLRRTHAAHLPSSERMLAVYDDALLGEGDEGIVLTAQRVCWKNVGGVAQSIPWRALDPESLYAEGQRLFVGIGTITVSGDAAVLEAAARAFLVLALSARVPPSHTQPMASAPPLPSSFPTHRPSYGPSIESTFAPLTPTSAKRTA